MDKEKRRTRGVPMLDAEWNAAAELGVLMGKAERGRPVSTAEAIRRAVSQAVAAYGRGDEQEARTQAQGDVPAEQAVGFARRGHAKTQRVQKTAAQASRGQREGQQDAERAHPSGGRARLPEPNPTGGAFRPFLKQDQIRKPKK